MMIKNTNLFFFIMLSTIFGCTSNGEEVETYYDDGSLKSKSIVKESRMNGESIEYYKNGKVKSISNWENDIQVDENKHFYSNGQLKSQSFLEQGKLQGLMKYYDSLSNLQEEANWVYGELNGVRKGYHSNGEVSFLAEYKMGEPIGKFKYYDRNGLLKKTIDYGRNDGVNDIDPQEFNVVFSPRSDSIKFGEYYELTISFYNPSDSVSVLIGKLGDDNKLIDTISVLDVKMNKATYKVVGNNLGEQRLEGIVQDIKMEENRLLVKSMPFIQKYNVIN